MGKMDSYKLKNMGRRGRTVKMSDETAEALRRQLERFREKFGREPGPEDPVFFDPDAETPQPMTSKNIDDIHHAMVEAAVQSGLPAQFIYAMNKTHRIVTENNMHLLDEEELDEWNAAIEEYFELNEKPPV